MRLLIADSDTSLAYFYETYFSGKGYDVTVTADGLECLRHMRQEVPDMLVLEYELPWGGGDGVLASLNEEYPATPMGVALITSDYSVEDLSDKLVPPVVGCMRKPFQLSELWEMVRSVTQQQP